MGFSGFKENSIGSDAERTEPEIRSLDHDSRNDAEKYVDTLLNSSSKDIQKKDSITDFYSDLASPSAKEKKNISNQQNTADRHGRT